MGHHMTPMAGGISDGQQYGLVFPAGFFQGFLSVLLQIRTGFVNQAIGSGSGRMVFGHGKILL